jgi:DNA (cytosine-5)-methyltransferase 1
MSLRELAYKAGVAETALRIAERGLDIPADEFLEAVATVLQADAAALRTAQRSLIGTAVPGEGYRTSRHTDQFIKRRQQDPEPGYIKVLDLFCGSGGFSQGFEQTGLFQVVGGVDLLPDRVETFVLNHLHATAVCGDIRSAVWQEALAGASEPDVVIGGPPCQGFSSIRPFRTLTEDDPRNSLAETFALVVDSVRPKWFVLENVVGLLSSNGGKTLNAMIRVFESIGYATKWKVLNACLYGLPQRRERLILVGNRQGVDFLWPEPSHHFAGRSMAGKAYRQRACETPLFGGTPTKAVSVMEAIGDLPVVGAGQRATQYRTDVELTDYQRKMRGTERVLTLHEATAHCERMMEIIKHSGANRSALPEGMTKSGFSTSYSRLEGDEPAVTITVNFVHPASNKCIHPQQDRALTPREGARLQGFPDAYKFSGTRAQVVKQIGNAVPPLLGRVIAHAVAGQMR